MLVMKFPQYSVLALEKDDNESVVNRLVSQWHSWSSSEGQRQVHIQQGSIVV